MAGDGVVQCRREVKNHDQITLSVQATGGWPGLERFAKTRFVGAHRCAISP